MALFSPFPIYERKVQKYISKVQFVCSGEGDFNFTKQYKQFEKAHYTISNSKLEERRLGSERGKFPEEEHAMPGESQTKQQSLKFSKSPRLIDPRE